MSFTRRLATFATLGLATAGLAGVTAQPAAAAPAPGTGSLTWEVSQLLGTARNGFPAPQPNSYVAPATYSAPNSTWSAGSGTVGADGSAELSFKGASVHWATTGSAWMSLADLAIDIDADGAGELTADVSYGTTAGDLSTKTTVRSANDVPIVDLSTAPGAGDATYPAAYAALDYGFEAGDSAYTWTNLRGRWSDELLAFLAGDAATSTPAYVYASTVVNTVDSQSRIRYPAPISMSIAAGAVAGAGTEVNVGAATAAGVPLAIEGHGFKKTAPGIYVSVRESAPGDPAYAGGPVQADAPTIWVSNNPADLEPGGPMGSASAVIEDDGSFDATLVLPPEFIESYDPTAVYTLVTRKAHGQGQLPANADQVSETPLDLSDLAPVVRAETSTDVKVTKKPTASKAGKLSVTVDGADAGDVRVTVKKGSKTVLSKKVSLSRAGKASVSLPKGGKKGGTFKVTASYVGTAAYEASSDRTSYTVKVAKKKRK